MRRLKILKIYFVLWLFIFFIIYANIDNVVSFFMATITFNVAVVTVLFIGLIVAVNAAFKLTMLQGTFAILRYKKGEQLEFYLQGIHKTFPPNIANMFKNRARKKVLYFTKNEIDDVLIWLEDKFSNAKVYINFFIGTVLMVGLFGTFTGLLKAIDEMGSIILGLSGDINLSEVIAGFSEPLSGMAIGFASSLFGVAAAIILSIMGYVLNRNEAIFLEDVMDWMKGQVLENQSDSQAVQQNMQGGSGGAVQGSSNMSGGMMDLFVDNISGLSNQMEKYNKSNEAMFNMLSQSIDNGNTTTKNQMTILEDISGGLKELNISQFSNANMMEESLQEISGAAMNETKTIKKLIDLQAQNNEMMSQFIEKIDKRIENIEKKVGN
ncbi:MAG: hypothetical protein U9Q04_04205 [Campylobacterota bacterium]|nr:hypothetical protein [Campylobacterota bacterium]